MKRFQSILITAGALLAVLVAVILFRAGTVARQGGSIGAVATSSQVSAPSVSPDALAPQAQTSSTPAFFLNAKAASAGNLATGALLYGWNADARWPVASMTKIMTAQIVLDLMDPQSVIALAPADFAAGPSSLTASLQPGDQYRVADLLKILLVPSSNEVAEALARSYGRAAFINAMNAKAAAWGLSSTHFADPSGISVANQSTPREFLQLAGNVYALHPEIFAITRDRSAVVQDLTTGFFKQFSTTNNFAGTAGFLGGKTGTTPEAGDNLLSVFETSGGPVAVLVFGAADRYASTRSLLQLIR